CPRTANTGTASVRWAASPGTGTDASRTTTLPGRPALPHLLDENGDAGTPPVRLRRLEFDDGGVVGDHQPGQRVENRPGELVYVRASRPVRSRLFDLLGVASRPVVALGAGQVEVELYVDGCRPQRLVAGFHHRLRHRPNVGTPRRDPLGRLDHSAIPEIPLRSLRGGVARYEEVEPNGLAAHCVSSA